MILRENIINELRDSIINGVYKPGEHLTETGLSLRFDVSRTPIREALHRLEKEGFIKITPDKGATVVKLSLRDISDIYDMLFALNGLGSNLACSKLTDRQISELEQIHFTMLKASSKKNLDLIFELNIQFHSMIIRATDNPYLIEAHLNFRSLLDQFGRISYLAPGQSKATLAEHRNILNAFRRRNPALAELLSKEHIQEAKRRILKYLSEIEEDSNRDNRSRDINVDKRFGLKRDFPGDLKMDYKNAIDYKNTE